MYLRVPLLNLDEPLNRQVHLLYLLCSIRPLPNLIPHLLYVINVEVREVCCDVSKPDDRVVEEEHV